MDAIRAASAAAIVAAAALGAVASIGAPAATPHYAVATVVDVGVVVQRWRREATGLVSRELARMYVTKAAQTEPVPAQRYRGFAAALFEQYLETFPDAEDFAQLQYDRAEVLWSSAEHEPNARIQIELWERAARTFTDVAKADRLDHERIRHAAHAAALAWQHAVVRGCGRWEPILDVRNPRPIPERTQQLLAAYRLYGDTIGDSNDDELSSIAVAEAREYARYGHVHEAIPLLYNIIERHRPGETLDEAVAVVVDLDRRLHGHDDIVAIVAQLGRDAVKPR